MITVLTIALPTASLVAFALGFDAGTRRYRARLAQALRGERNDG